MNILVINGSPKGERSDCMKLTRAFLEGMGEKAEVLEAAALNIKPCLGCLSCWSKTPGVCIHKDDMPGVLEKITASDLVIWSFPLYCYGMPAPAKAILDRVLPLSTPEQRVDEQGRTYHPRRKERNIRFMMISGCGFPNLDHNYEGMRFQFSMSFGAESPMICCAESPLLGIPEAAPVALPYLETVKKAGAEYARDGKISAETQKILDTPMLDPNEYRRNINP